MRLFRRAILLAVLPLIVIGALAGARTDISNVAELDAKGKLRIGLNADYPPFCVWHEGAPRGFDVELARGIAAKLGYGEDSVEFVPVTATQALEKLKTGKLDLAVAALTVNSERALSAAFTDPYYVATLGALVARAKIPNRQVENVIRPVPIESFLDLQKIEPITIAVKKNTTVETRTRKLLHGGKVVGYDSLTEAMAALSTGKVDALVHEDPYLRHAKAAKVGGYGRYVLAKKPVTVERIAIAVPLGHHSMVRWLNVYLRELSDTGELQRMIDKYFDHADWRSEVPWK